MIFSDDFIRDFFDVWPRHSTYDNLCASYTKEVVEKARELAKSQPPEANLMPYIQIVLDAARLNLIVNRNTQ